MHTSLIAQLLTIRQSLKQTCCNSRGANVMIILLDRLPIKCLSCRLGAGERNTGRAKPFAWTATVFPGEPIVILISRHQKSMQETSGKLS